MGEVYRARDTRLDRIVAVKVSKERFSERFEREAQAVAALNHPHICTLYDVGPDYLVMEYVDGARLKGPLPLDQALEYAAQICDALDAAHSKGITHRDLKLGQYSGDQIRGSKTARLRTGQAAARAFGGRGRPGFARPRSTAVPGKRPRAAVAVGAGFESGAGGDRF
jgi:serine/threonine protein kinase